VFIYLLFHILYLFALTLREVCLHSHSESGHHPPDHKVTNYVISKICDVTQSEFARVPTRGPWVRGWATSQQHNLPNNPSLVHTISFCYWCTKNLDFHNVRYLYIFLISTSIEWIDIANTEYRYTAIRIPVNTSG
jgi:hypothetical protein